MDFVGSREIVLARGHENILATHEKTVEITKGMHLSEKGDCIIGVGADKAVCDLSPEFRQKLQRDRARIAIRIEVCGLSETINASGDARLVLTHPTDMVIRKSGYICARTLAVHADKSAGELSREVIRRLRHSDREVKITLVVKS